MEKTSPGDTINTKPTPAVTRSPSDAPTTLGGGGDARTTFGSDSDVSGSGSGSSPLGSAAIAPAHAPITEAHHTAPITTALGPSASTQGSVADVSFSSTAAPPVPSTTSGGGGGAGVSSGAGVVPHRCHSEQPGFIDCVLRHKIRHAPL